MSVSVVAIVLAAGHGRRMGQPKALLKLDGEALLAGHVSRFREAGLLSIVVTRTSLRASVAALLGAEARLVVGDTPSQAHSLQLAVASLPPETSAVLVTPVDLRPASPSTLHALSTALAPDVDAVTPSYRGRGGHPVLVRPQLLGGTQPLRVVLAAARRIVLPVDDGHVLDDFDRPADLAALGYAIDQPCSS